MGEQADFIIDRIIERHMSVNGLVDRDYNRTEFNTVNVWITSNDEMLYYHQIGERHARNILAQVKRLGNTPAPELLDRIAYFDSKVLF